MNPIIFILLCLPFLSLAQNQYIASVHQSEIHWYGKSIIGGGHDGIVRMRSGSITTNSSNQIVSGNFVVDMNTIQTLDGKKPKNDYTLNLNAITGQKEEKDGLADHLRSADFFDTKLFPTASFQITQVTAVAGKPDEFNVTGFLSIKGVTNSIQFPAQISSNGNVIKAKADVVFDRTKWNIIYHSKTFFAELKNEAISDEVRLTLDLVFSK